MPGEDQLTPHFSRSELSCPHCGAMGFEAEALTRLEQIRIAYAFPLPVNSGYRCPAHNAAVSGTGLTGPHTRPAGAFDLRTNPERLHRLLAVAFFHGATGIGIPESRGWAHIDFLSPAEAPRPRVWLYRGK